MSAPRIKSTRNEGRVRTRETARANTHARSAPWRCSGAQTCWEIAWNCIKADVLKTNNGTMK